jgi:farnesyl-diphosphate farnesyltransferase
MLPFKSKSVMSEFTSPPESDSVDSAAKGLSLSDDDFQAQMLQRVSRTFALTIPQLPPLLYRVVSNAYLLCRIIDTIEDEPAFSSGQRKYFCEQFLKALNGEINAEKFPRQVCVLLSSKTPPAEHELIRDAARVVRITVGFSEPQRGALLRCVHTMARGMEQFQKAGQTHGLQNLEDLDRYCYYVAGVVGQMLTRLFCFHAQEIAKNHDALMAFATSFGQGLQMTNILKDVWEDDERGACWLPRNVFAEEGFDLDDLKTGRNRRQFERGIQRLIGIAHRHLKNALAYTLLIPRQQTGIRNFCLWAIGLAVLTLRKINKRLSYTSGNQVKISRLSVKGTILATRLTLQNDFLLKLLFSIAARPLPLASHLSGFSPNGINEHEAN